MSGRETKKRRKHPARRAASAKKRIVKPALGNDPFESGAAARPSRALEPASDAEFEPRGAGSEVGEPAAIPVTRAPPEPTGPVDPEPTAQPERVAGAEPVEEPVAEAAPAAEPDMAPEPEPVLAAEPPIEPPVATSRATPAAEIETAATDAAAPSTGVEPPVNATPVASHDDTSVGHARDLLQALARLAPLLREKLGQFAGLARILERSGELDPYGMDRELAATAAPVLDFLYSTWWRVKVRQIEHVPANGPVIVIANHGGALPWDALVLRLALSREHPTRRDLRPLLDDAVMRAPLLGFLAARLGAVSATPENALQLLAQASAVGFFPEGSAGGGRSWTQRYRVQQFGRGGFARVAIRAGASVVPCAIVGSEETSAPPARSGWLGESLGVPLLAPALRVPLGPLGLLPLPARWSLRFGEPLAADAHGPGAAADASRVFDLTERTRSALQQMLDEDVAARRSVYL